MKNIFSRWVVIAGLAVGLFGCAPGTVGNAPDGIPMYQGETWSLTMLDSAGKTLFSDTYSQYGPPKRFNSVVKEGQTIYTNVDPGNYQSGKIEFQNLSFQAGFTEIAEMKSPERTGIILYRNDPKLKVKGLTIYTDNRLATSEQTFCSFSVTETRGPYEGKALKIQSDRSKQLVLESQGTCQFTLQK